MNFATVHIGGTSIALASVLASGIAAVLGAECYATGILAAGLPTAVAFVKAGNGHEKGDNGHARK